MYASAEYFSMMQQCEMPLSNTMGMQQMRQQQNPQYLASTMHGLPLQQPAPMQQQMPHADMFDSPQELQRRTMTQAQFDSLAAQHSNGGLSSGFDVFQTSFSDEPELNGNLNGNFPSDLDFKPQDAACLYQHIPAPMSSLDSTVPSEQSLNTFPSSSSMQEHVGSSTSSLSASSSQWGDSRSSSMSESPFTHLAAPQPQHPHHHAISTSVPQWQPGQSIPVDIEALNEQFAQIAQARSATHTEPPEQPMAYPSDEAYAHPLAHSMSHVELHTPQPQATFVSPLPAAPAATSIALRRQRPRPATLSLRSQSYSGTPAPAAPSPTLLSNANTNNNLRCIRSNNVVAQGRVHKLPGSAQRSPLGWAFPETVHANSPKSQARRQASVKAAGLAPPSPMSPRFRQPQQVPAWYPPPSAEDTQLPFATQTQTHATMHAFTSPPHTPMYHQQTFALHPQRSVGKDAIMENTPPQSAPAGQSCFPSHPLHMRNQQQQQQQQMMHTLDPVYTVPQQQYAPPQQTQQQQQQQSFVPLSQQQIAFHHHQQQQHQQQQQQQQTPPHVAYPTFTHQNQNHAQHPPPSYLLVAPAQPQPPQQPEVFFHEWNPPKDAKRAAAAAVSAAAGRKSEADAGLAREAPKTFVFSNQGPEAFEKGKKAGAPALAS